MDDPAFLVIDINVLHIVMLFNASNKIIDAHHVQLVYRVGESRGENPDQEFLFLSQLAEHGILNGQRSLFVEVSKSYPCLPIDDRCERDHDA